MKVYAHLTNNSEIILSSKNKEGYTKFHSETNMPYGDSFLELKEVWEIPGVYEDSTGQIIVSNSYDKLVWNWSDKPVGSKLLEKV